MKCLAVLCLIVLAVWYKEGLCLFSYLPLLNELILMISPPYCMQMNPCLHINLLTIGQHTVVQSDGSAATTKI